MAIYDLGTASMAANGEVTGAGTTWKSPLTLIRVGATIVFKTEPVQIYTISEIISDTQINVYNPNSETVPSGTGYAILAHDGITVQGLAQDVAETLRYYQSKETSIESLLQFIGQNTFDWPRFEQLASQSVTGAAESLASQIAAAESAATAVSARDTTTAARDQTIEAINNAGDASTLVTLANWGIGSKNNNPIEGFDWQNHVLVSGQILAINTATMINAPDQIKAITSSGSKRAFIQCNDVIGNQCDLTISISTSTESGFSRLSVRWVGAKGSRSFAVREDLLLQRSTDTGIGVGSSRIRGLLDVYSKGETFLRSSNLSDIQNKEAARINLDVYSKADLGGVSSLSRIGSASYADIRSYAGSDYAISCYGRETIADNAFGIFHRDDSDTASQDNDGTILVDALGRIWKRSYTGPVDARWFGVKSDGVSDDTAAANRATSTLQDVTFPPGEILISGPILFGTQNISGSSTYPNSKYGTIIQCSGDHSGFEHFPTGYQPGGSIANFWINYQAGKPTADSGFSRGIDFGTRDPSIDPLTGGVTNFKVENVIVRGAYYGFYDVTSAYLMEYVNCWAWDCIQGFRKDYGTTVKYSSCYSLDCYASWALKYCHVATLVNCAYDGSSNFGNLTPFIATQCPGLTITGMQHESSKVNISGGSDFVLVDCNSAKISGFSIPSWRNQNPQGGEGYLFRFTNSDVDISGVNLSGFVSGGSSDVISDGANSYVVLANSGSNVRVSASNLPAVSGSQYSYSLSASADSRIDYTSNCDVGGLVNGAVFINGFSKPSYIDYTVTLAANGGMAFLGSVSVPGVKYGDFINVDVSSGLSGIDIFASRAGGGTGSVNVFLVNHNTSEVSVSGQAVIRFMRP